MKLSQGLQDGIMGPLCTSGNRQDTVTEKNMACCLKEFTDYKAQYSLAQLVANLMKSVFYDVYDLCTEAWERQA